MQGLYDTAAPAQASGCGGQGADLGASTRLRGLCEPSFYCLKCRAGEPGPCSSLIPCVLSREDAVLGRGKASSILVINDIVLWKIGTCCCMAGTLCWSVVLRHGLLFVMLVMRGPIQTAAAGKWRCLFSATVTVQRVPAAVTSCVGLKAMINAVSSHMQQAIV